VVLAVVAVGVIIYIQEGQRRIPIQYASRVRGRRMYQGGQTFLPLRVNLAGVIPIIFAISILQFPAQLALYFRLEITSRDIARGS
jgi:preprotein translocase subunit SecY